MNMLVSLRVPTLDPAQPGPAPLSMPVRPHDRPIAARPLATPPQVRRRRLAVLALTLPVVALLAVVMAQGLWADGVSFGDLLILALYLPTITWIAFSASTAVCGAFWHPGASRAPAPPDAWTPRARTAILIPVRNEEVAPLGDRLGALRKDLARQGLSTRTDIFILSDSDDPRTVEAEEGLAEELSGTGFGAPAVYYRRRRTNEQRKPGNIGEWVRRWGGAYGYMLVFDADSRMSARRIRALIFRMERRPQLGLIQTGVRLTGAETRFGRMQQLATRLYGGAFAAGIAGWAGDEGNYWGHNALIRVRAFAGAAGLPTLSGAAPFGGDILSHDFVEAAWLRRAGWAVEIDPDSRGSAEGGPQTIEAYHKRDRRWCQGNLQHMQLLRTQGINPISRLHLICGLFGYFAAPLWLALVVAAIAVGPSGALLAPALGAAALILAQKIAGVLVWMRRRPGIGGKLLRLAAAELAISTLLAPSVMLRQTVAVFSVLSGQDCGWKPASAAGRSSRADRTVWLEPAVAAALILAALPGDGMMWRLILVLPIVAPLLVTPLLVRWLDRRPGARPVPREPRAGDVTLLQAAVQR